MHQETRNLTGWMEWGKEQGQPIPFVAQALGALPIDHPALPAHVHNMMTVRDAARDAIIRMQMEWNDGNWFQFHLLGEHSAFLTPQKFDKALKKKKIGQGDMLALMQSASGQFAAQKECMCALNLPSDLQETRKALKILFNSEETAFRAFLTLSLIVSSRVMMEELLSFINNEEFSKLPNVQEVIRQSIPIQLLDINDPLPTLPEALLQMQHYPQ